MQLILYYITGCGWKTHVSARNEQFIQYGINNKMLRLYILNHYCIRYINGIGNFSLFRVIYLIT